MASEQASNKAVKSVDKHHSLALPMLRMALVQKTGKTIGME